MPLYITPQLQLSERYIENTYANTNQRSEDYILSAIASLNIVYQFSNGHLGTNYSFETDYSTQTYLANRLNGNQYGNLEYLYQERRWSAGVNGSLVSTRYGETVPQFNEGMLTPGTEYHQETAGVQGSYLLTRQLNFSMSYAYGNNEYSSSAYVDSESHAISSSLGYQLNSSDQFALLGGANLFRYKHGSSYKMATAGVQWKHNIGESAVIQAATGAGEATGRILFWTANLSVSKNFERGSIQAGYSRNFGTGGGLADTAVITQQLTASASKNLRQALSGNISGSLGDSAGVFPGSSYQVKFWNTTASLSYQLLKWLNSSISYSHYYQEVEGRATESLHSNQILLTLSTNLLPWRPF